MVVFLVKLLKWLKWFGNRIDDPFDNLKHKLHGSKIFGYRFYFPRWLMKGGTNPWWGFRKED